jgi:hypothetical protein
MVRDDGRSAAPRPKNIGFEVLAAVAWKVQYFSQFA